LKDYKTADLAVNQTLLNTKMNTNISQTC